MREDLYEQCSDHMTEKIPSSTRLGSRPSSSFIRSNSCCVRLCAEITSGVIILKDSAVGAALRGRPSHESCVFQTTGGHGVPPLQVHLIALFNSLLDCLTQLSSIDPSDVLENYFALFVVQISCRQVTTPAAVHEVDGRLWIRDVQQVSWHRGVHRLQKLRHARFDICHVIERDSEKLE